MEMPSNFDYELRKWALESIFFVALDHRLNIVKGETTENRSIAIIKAVDDFFKLSFPLEILPSLWRLFPTPKYTQLMKSFDMLTNTAMYYIDQAIARVDANDANDSNREKSVLEKLVKVDRQVAVAVALDLILAGIDTVRFIRLIRIFNLAVSVQSIIFFSSFFLKSRSDQIFVSSFLYRPRPPLSIAYSIWPKIPINNNVYAKS